MHRAFVPLTWGAPFSDVMLCSLGAVYPSRIARHATRPEAFA